MKEDRLLTPEEKVELIDEFFAKQKARPLDSYPTCKGKKQDQLQERVNEYLQAMPNFPLEEGQLVGMVILHFDIPDKEAKILVDNALKMKQDPELREKTADIRFAREDIGALYGFGYLTKQGRDKILALIGDVRKQECEACAEMSTGKALKESK